MTQTQQAIPSKDQPNFQSLNMLQKSKKLITSSGIKHPCMGFFPHIFLASVSLLIRASLYMPI